MRTITSIFISENKEEKGEEERKGEHEKHFSYYPPLGWAVFEQGR